MKRIIIILCVLTIITACSGKGGLISNGSESSSSYPSAVAWNNTLYGLSIAEVPVKDVGKELGRIDRVQSPMPLNNGESNDKPVGTTLFEIIGKSTQEEIAIKVGDVFFSASKLGPLK
ncbi:hypothetical protein [Cohnella kolymensis]|nr:hypothetical protein [Cohnella kolymensis]